MNRVRLSTTVDRELLDTCRRLVDERDSLLIDRALRALVEQVYAAKEIAALEAHPYHEDADLSWSAPPGPSLPYDGDVPDDVRRLAQRRRRR